MSLAEINEIMDKATQYAHEKTDKTIEASLDIAIKAQSESLKIKQNKELIDVCEKIYSPMKIEKWVLPEKIAEWTPEQKMSLSKLEPETIFKKFETTYVTDNYLKEYKKTSEK